MVTDAPIDLRSDTVTRPTAAMRAAMAEAEVGDDVFGEDPETAALEQEVADLLGCEAGLFTPSGSMANQLGLRLLVGPGEELVADQQAHVVRAELGAAAVFSGITTRTWASDRGRLVAAAVQEIAEPNAGAYSVSTAAIAVENTHNFGGGTVQPLDEVRAVQSYAREHGIALHLDGARLWNAHVASGTPLPELAAGFDTVSVCLSKGLGAPVGSVLVASRERVDAARIWRKRYGGGMRQTGFLAAAGRFALRHHVDRLADDHANARVLAAALDVDPDTVQTNIVFAEVSDPAAFVARAAERGVVLMQLGPRRIRLVTHLDVSREDAVRAAEVLAALPR
ncbi:aminotransferase class I/II-fold pyridoxal phosphate-dependent enzyme [Curtobacterium pusillum]|uniref:Aminotransferase class I/II-fold pyridoxal phosphate-dependent enzyme n=1 Tax=Curtobacterium pusillum TaxID=69373 RepID=A0ABX2MB11_9MICO|nr:aminotransferase class I/II-fold pyridoxal phosphate-dependent enzyme [Curtobacterium pusillum]